MGMLLDLYGILTMIKDNLRPRYTATFVKMSGLQDKIDNIEETLKSYEAEIPVIVEGIDIDNILINEQFIDEKYNASLKNELLNNIKSCISDQLKTLVRTQISELRYECFFGRKVKQR